MAEIATRKPRDVIDIISQCQSFATTETDDAAATANGEESLRSWEFVVENSTSKGYLRLSTEMRQKLEAAVGGDLMGLRMSLGGPGGVPAPRLVTSLEIYNRNRTCAIKVDATFWRSLWIQEGARVRLEYLGHRAQGAVVGPIHLFTVQSLGAMQDASDAAPSAADALVVEEAPMDVNPRPTGDWIKRFQPNVDRAARPRVLREWGAEEEGAGGKEDDDVENKGDTEYQALSEASDSEEEGSGSGCKRRYRSPVLPRATAGDGPSVGVTQRSNFQKIRHCPNDGPGAPPNDLEPPAAQVRPVYKTIRAHRKSKVLTFGKPCMQDILCAGFGLDFPLKRSILGCFWAERSGEQHAFYCVLSNRDSYGTGGIGRFRALGEYLGVFNAPESSKLEFRLLGTSPAPPGHPEIGRVYHLAVKKCGVKECPADASAAPPAKKARPSPAGPTPPGPVPAAAFSPPESSAPSGAAATPPLHPLLLKKCAQGFSDIEQLAHSFSSAPAMPPPVDAGR